jgi:Uncharacterized protein conserved in bacteria (DUF2188)
MTKLLHFTLVHNAKEEQWELKHDKSKEVIKAFDKEDATKGGVLEKALGATGGSVKIQKMDGKIQEERTYPKSADPKKSPG